jgi:methionyl-tRNA formyltransferase
MKNVSILGKGRLAVNICKWIDQKGNKYNLKLKNIVPVFPEPKWGWSLNKWSENNGFPTYKDHKELNDGLDLVISVFYEKIIQQDFINKCKTIINIHNAPLPKYRGVRPINWALKNGEKYHGVTIHSITAGIDEGPIYGKILYPIYPNETLKNVYDKSLDYAFILFKDVITKLDNIIPEEQDHSQATYYSNKDIINLGNFTKW